MTQSSKARKKILVIDDDRLVGESLRNLLEKLGFEVTVAPVGLRALDLVSRIPVDLIVSDIRMPYMGGIETLKAIRELRRDLGLPSIPEIVITAFDEESVREEAERMGIRDFILKPFDMKDFMDALERYLGAGVSVQKGRG